jgi:hypothetical protein
MESVPHARQPVLPKRAGVPPATTWSVQPKPDSTPVARPRLAGAVVTNNSGCESANDGPLLQTFGTLSRRNFYSVAHHEHRFSDLSGKGSHLQRKTLVTEADRTVRPEQMRKSILDVVHCALQVGRGSFFMGLGARGPRQPLWTSVAGTCSVTRTGYIVDQEMRGRR